MLYRNSTSYYLKQCWQERLDGQECKANDSGDRMRTARAKKAMATGKVKQN